MSKPRGTLLIDGSNVVHALFDPVRGHSELDGHAASMLRLLSEWSSREPGVEVEVVFDGGWRRIGSGGARVRVLFAEGESADALLLERVRALRYDHKKVSVVTLDRDLAGALKAEEAKVVHPERLWDWISGGHGR